ncbi:Polygalacturonate 4-alpha-galacturonosyltransferase [Zea mays]|uniref:Hexosyltransferase n=1 Tax=Zea mays TaxID=4577 RepID=A0A1D6GK87_MAIZE|nr:Polygalacturonate 4-alpha-galacturonosyltransferase [Zea mays]
MIFVLAARSICGGAGASAAEPWPVDGRCRGGSAGDGEAKLVALRTTHIPVRHRHSDNKVWIDLVSHRRAEQCQCTGRHHSPLVPLPPKAGTSPPFPSSNLFRSAPSRLAMAIRAGRSALHLHALAFLILAASPCLQVQALVDHRKQISDWGRQPNFELQNMSSSQRDGSHLLGRSKEITHRKLRGRIGVRNKMEVVQQDDEALVKLENTGIERSKAVDSAVLGKYSIWRRENENEKADSRVRLMRDQMIMARIYSVLAKSRGKLDLYQELLARLKESQRSLGEATADAELPKSASDRIKAMGQVLSKARDLLYDCKEITQRLRAMLQSADEQVRSLKKQSTFLSQLAAKTIPNGIHCLSMRLTIDYYLLSPEKRKFPNSENLENPDLYHYALFSDNVLAASVVVNSTIMNAKEPEKHVFHLVTDKLNFGAMNMWFLLNPPGDATMHVENVDDFKWLNSSYCPVLKQLESAAMKEYYFKADRPKTLSAGSSNLKYRNPKYLSMLNHLRFYLPQNENRLLWKLGTLPPGLLTFYKLTHPLDKSWHVLGLGYNPTVERSEIDNAAVIHYNGNMKPWLEIAMTKYRPYWTKYINYEHPYIHGCKFSQ